MSKQEDFHLPKNPLEKTREMETEARTSNKAEINKKFNKNQR